MTNEQAEQKYQELMNKLHTQELNYNIWCPLQSNYCNTKCPSFSFPRVFNPYRGESRKDDGWTVVPGKCRNKLLEQSASIF